MSGQETANDNQAPPTDGISLSDLAGMMQVDEDTLLRRLAKITSERKENGDGNDAA